jgi:prephenate dehydrogenase
MQFESLAIVGVGLLGGSLGLAAKARGLVRHVVGVGRDPAKRATALELGAIDEAHAEIADAIPSADLVVVCTPVDLIARHVLEIAEFAKPGCIVTDVGSTKNEIVQSLANRLPPRIAFVGSHPMAGSEKKGPAHAVADLFVNRATILTPTAESDPTAVERLKRFWEGVGSRVVTMSPGEHDRAVANVSHLPHAVAAALAGAVDPAFLGISAGGFRDTTRIAAAAPAIWEPIFRTNREEMLAGCARFAARFDEFRQLLAADDGPGLIRWLNEGKKVRDALGS